MNGPCRSGSAATGHPETTIAAIEILEAGGNAMDAALAAALTSTVCEPLLMGFGGGGVFTVREGDTGRVQVLDCFSVFPGLEHGLEEREFRAISVDYGPTTQCFHAGAGAVAVPSIASGLAAFHERWCTLPRERLARYAIHRAREGWVTTAATEIVSTMLAPILCLGTESASIYSPGGSPLREGVLVRSEAVAAALEDFARDGAEPFLRGRHAQSLVKAFGPPYGSLGLDDLANYNVRFVDPLVVNYQGATLYLPPPPCAGGALLAFGLLLLERLGKNPTDPHWMSRCLASVMSATERVRKGGFDQDLFKVGVIEALLDPRTLDRYTEEVRNDLRRDLGALPPAGPAQGSVPGNTTHISTIDRHGNAVSFTSSNGETCGQLWPSTGFTVNNFLGEDDIHPLGFHQGPPGSPLRTMMTPSLMVGKSGGVVALGTGGSNRIRTAMLQVLAYLIDGDMNLEQAILQPRIHVEGETVQAEDTGQGDEYLRAVCGSNRKLARFTGRHLYFGGVHSVGLRPDGSIEAVGDPRRVGVGQVAGPSS
jgi:gamma-glutamyltranspeptidase/glutathione hydrolase